MWHHARRTTRGGDDKAGGWRIPYEADYILPLYYFEEQETIVVSVHTIGKSHETSSLPHVRCMGGINESPQDLPKNPKLDSFPPASYQIFFLFRAQIVPASPNPDGAHTHHESFENVSMYASERDNNLAPHWFMRAGYLCPGGN